jgi:hypothetical protein
MIRISLFSKWILCRNSPTVMCRVSSSSSISSSGGEASSGSACFASPAESPQISSPSKSSALMVVIVFVFALLYTLSLCNRPFTNKSTVDRTEPDSVSLRQTPAPSSVMGAFHAQTALLWALFSPNSKDPQRRLMRRVTSHESYPSP